MSPHQNIYPQYIIVKITIVLISAITSLLPLVLLPLAGVLGTKEVKVITIDDDGGYYDDDGGGDCP